MNFYVQLSVQSRPGGIFNSVVKKPTEMIKDPARQGPVNGGGT
jgi:hypothetical protein